MGDEFRSYVSRVIMKVRGLLRWLAVAASAVLLPLTAQAQQKTAKACEGEWRANKAAIQGAGKTKKAFMAECRSGTGQSAAARPAAPAPSAPPAAGAPTDQNTAQTPAPRRRSAARQLEERRQRGTATSAGAGVFATEAEARSHCPGQTVVWANTASKIYHFSGSRRYGSTKKGAYMCERDTAQAGYRVAKNEKRPR
jgi:hypothetical protein